MALHCPATVYLAEEGVPVPPLDGLAGSHGPWGEGADVMAEIQAVADLHRGERVLVTVAAGGTADVLFALGRVVPDDAPGPGIRLEVGDDGWVVLPWESAETG